MTAERVYGVLLRLFPRDFRDEYAAEMRAAFAEMWQQNRRSAAAFWAFVVTDTLRSAARERLETLRWLATAMCGLLVTTATADGAAWAYHYFYHPYLEGFTVRAIPYGLELGVVLGGSVGVAQWLLFPAIERQARRWGLASAVALPITVLFCGAAVRHVLVGMNPVAVQHPFAFDVVLFGLAASKNWADLVTQFSGMTVSAFVVRALLSARGQPRAGASGSA
jgi:hypothetical protein